MTWAAGHAIQAPQLTAGRDSGSPSCRGEPQPDLPGSPIGLPRHPATASGLQACKKRKGTHTSSRQERATGDGGGDTATGGGRGRASAEAYEWDDAWDERSDADVSFSLPAGQPVDGCATVHAHTC